MRLITTFDTEQEAYVFYSFLLKEGIHAIYESQNDAKTGKKNYPLWIYEEEDFSSTIDWLKEFKEHPRDARFQDISNSLTPPSPSISEVPKGENLNETIPAIGVRARNFRMTFTHLLLLLCVGLFLWNEMQQGRMQEARIPTPLEQTLMYDSPFVEKEGGWRGLLPFFHSGRAGPLVLFAKIREGELWRLFTPCLLHADFLHILFNMAWLLLLGKQIEEKIRPLKMAMLILTIGILSNTAQYLMSGPSFLGFSGVIVGMATFIWMRQRKAPWEGYATSRTTLYFLLLFVLAMCVLEGLALVLHAFSVFEISPAIANTAHITGGLCGLLLGQFSFFARVKRA
jgi:GlpG protein